MLSEVSDVGLQGGVDPQQPWEPGDLRPSLFRSKAKKGHVAWRHRALNVRNLADTSVQKNRPTRGRQGGRVCERM